jgi:hypothetical protein
VGRRDGRPGVAVVQAGRRAVVLDHAEALAVADRIVDAIEHQQRCQDGPEAANLDHQGIDTTNGSDTE